MENLKRVGIVNENVEHIKRSFKDTEQSMLFVKKAVDELVEATKEIYNTVEIISTLTKTINKIADKTKILALNASIEAVRAGQNGKGFAVIAQEVRELAQATTEATKDVTIKAKEVFGTIEKIKEKMCAIDHQVQRTYNLVCLNREKLEQINQPIKELTLNAESLNEISANLDGTTATLSNTISKLSELIEKTTHSSSTLKTYSERLHSLSEEQILTVGKARVDLYDYAKEIIQEAASSFELRSMHRPTMENYLKRLIQQHEIFELLYITNDQGIQITGYGENWSSRPWFINVKESLDTYISDIYVSLATNSYCLTISCPIFDDKHRLIGVLGADLDLKKVIEGDRSLTQKINGLDKVDTKTLS
jgi:chromosome segregation ATPase